MTPPFIRKDMLPLPDELGCAPCAKHRVVEIDRETFEEFQALAKRRYTSVKKEINLALKQWRGIEA
jgi:hypothetical protein